MGTSCKGRHAPEGRAVSSVAEPVNSVEQSLIVANSRTVSQQFPTFGENMKFINANRKSPPLPNGLTASHVISLRVILPAKPSYSKKFFTF